ncbi:uncharacterized protein LOC131180658 [Hevea brasiliensis]|uniref:uncharacterized protein LOC131180658 n=1 Tax=Hevea brasiliensis TaxID=3981 RepID=UPI0025F514A9|nr:uncharacterized protein LOC131180658 [Hevea brasiliensis]
MPFKRYVEIGRVALINYGKDYRKLSVIVYVIDQNQASIVTPNMVMGKENDRKKIKAIVMVRILAEKIRIGEVAHGEISRREKSRVGRDQGHLNPKPTEPKDRISHQNILSEEANTHLVDSLQRSVTENQKLQERIRQLEDQQHILGREVKRLKEEAMAEKTEFEEQETRWKKEKISLLAAIKEAKV